MKIGFFLPSPTTLKHDWYKNALWQKVGIPYLAGWLKRAGFPDIAHYDFNNQVLKAYASSPGDVRLMRYGDAQAVNKFLRSDEPVIRRQTEFLLDVLEVERKDLFGISLTYFVGDLREIALGMRLAQCMAKTLKERFPGSAVMLGGMQNIRNRYMWRHYAGMMRECPDIDYSVCGDGHLATLEICRAVAEGRRPLARPPLRIQAAGKGLLLEEEIPNERGGLYSRLFYPLSKEDTRDPSVPFGLPAYDKANSKAFSYTGRQLRELYHLPSSLAGLEPRGARDNHLTVMMSFTEGCPFGCRFCGNSRSELFCLPPEELVRILTMLVEELGCRNFLFYNPNFNPTYKYAHEVLERIIKADLDIQFADCFNFRNMDQELIAMMREAGAVKVVAGAEYPTRRMLKYIDKGVTVEKITRNLELMHKAGIWNHVLLITGMPTETWDDVRELESWLRDTRDYIDSYIVGSYHMLEMSIFGKNPEKYGFKLKGHLPIDCQDAFDEIGGLSWKEKRKQNALTNRYIRTSIEALKGSLKPTGAKMDDSVLLMYLYRVLGHDRKSEIRQLWEAAYAANPHIARSHAYISRQLASPLSRLRRQLRGAGVEMELSPATEDTISFTLRKGRMSLRCSLRARSEDILINPGKGLVHGDFFVLREGEKSCEDRNKARLAELLRRGGARLRPEEGRPLRGQFPFRLETREGSARLTISALGRTCRAEILSGRPDGGLLSEAGRLLLASAALSRSRSSAAMDLAALKKEAPGVLRAAESWCAGNGSPGPR